MRWRCDDACRLRAPRDNAALYRIGRSTLARRAFHDITTGDNSTSFPPRVIHGYNAKRGWDPATGWGSPDAAVLVPLLARLAKATDAHGL